MFASSFATQPVTFSYVGKAEAPQGKADVLDVKGPAGPGAFAARLFISDDTHLPIMMSWTAPAPPMRGQPPSPPGPPAVVGGAATSHRRRNHVSTSRDYRDVSGMQFPFRLRRAVGPDTVEETTFDGFKINGKIDPKKFEVRR